MTPIAPQKTHPTAECILALEHLVADKLDPITEKILQLTVVVEKLVESNTKLEHTVRGKNLDNGLQSLTKDNSTALIALTSKLDNISRDIKSNKKEFRKDLGKIEKDLKELENNHVDWYKPMFGWILGAYAMVLASTFGLIKWVASQIDKIQILLDK